MPVCSLNPGGRFSFTSAECAQVGGTIKENYWGNTCVLKDKLSPASCYEDCFGPNGPKFAPMSGCVNPDLTQAQCVGGAYGSSKPQWVYWNWLWTGNNEPPVQICQTWVNSPSSCNSAQWPGWSWRALQPDDDDSRLQRCGREACFHPTLNQTACEELNHRNWMPHTGGGFGGGFTMSMSYWYGWDVALNNGTGACTTWLHQHNANWSAKAAECAAASTGFVYWPGRSYQHGSAYTQSLCEAGLCNVNPSYTPAECAASAFCTYPCMGRYFSPHVSFLVCVFLMTTCFRQDVFRSNTVGALKECVTTRIRLAALSTTATASAPLGAATSALSPFQRGRLQAIQRTESVGAVQ